MATADRERDELAGMVAEELVSAIAPEELVTFPVTAEAYFASPAQGRAARPRDEMLGFGVAEVATALSPIALAVAEDVVGFLWNEIATTLRSETRPRVAAAVRRVLDRLLPTRSAAPATPTQAPAVVLTPAQVAQVHARALATARKLGLSEARAGAMADGLVARLVIDAAG